MTKRNFFTLNTVKTFGGLAKITTFVLSFRREMQKRKDKTTTNYFYELHNVCAMKQKLSRAYIYVYTMRYAGSALRVDLCISRCVYMDSPKTENKISLIYK